MAQSPVIYALKRKRAVISGELRKAEDRCAAMRQEHGTKQSERLGTKERGEVGGRAAVAPRLT